MNIQCKNNHTLTNLAFHCPLCRDQLVKMENAFGLLCVQFLSAANRKKRRFFVIRSGGKTQLLTKNDSVNLKDTELEAGKFHIPLNKLLSTIIKGEECIDI